jgi:hypothetical protein
MSRRMQLPVIIACSVIGLTFGVWLALVMHWTP